METDSRKRPEGDVKTSSGASRLTACENTFRMSYLRFWYLASTMTHLTFRA